MEVVGQPDDRVDNRHVGLRRQHCPDEGLVDFQFIQGEPADIAQAGITGTEIVNGQFAADRFQLVHDIQRNGNIFHHDAFRHFDFQI